MVFPYSFSIIKNPLVWYDGRRESDTDGDIYFSSLNDGENEGNRLVNGDYLCKII